MRPYICRVLFMLTAGLCTGCGVTTRDVAGLLHAAVGEIQVRDQELPPVLVERGETIIINETVVIIEDPAVDVVVVELPNQTILGFENITGYDIYLEFLVDDVLQAVFVYDGEALLLEYPCLDSIELLAETDIDPVTLEVVDSYDLSGIVFFNPDDFFCGDAFILTFDPFSISAEAEVVDILP